jgi:tRNA-splicing ligase RtcB
VLQEEASEAYKDVTDIVQIVHEAGISRKIVKTIPLAVVKG